jgi:hypothetical protein
MTTQLAPATATLEPSRRGDRAMQVLQYGIALIAVLGAALLGFR